MSRDTSCGREKDVNLFQKGQIIDQAKKTSKEFAETTKIGIITVQQIGLRSNGRRSCGLMSPDLPCSRVMGSAMIWGCCTWSGLGSATWPEYTEWPGYSINGFVLPWWHGHIPRWQCQDSSGSNCERVVQVAWDIMFTHGLATTESRP